MSLITLLLNRSHSASVIFPLLWFPSKAALPSRIPPISLEGQGPQRGCHTVNIFSKNQFRFIKSIHIYRYLNIGNGMLYIYMEPLNPKIVKIVPHFRKKRFQRFFQFIETFCPMCIIQALSKCFEEIQVLKAYECHFDLLIGTGISARNNIFILRLQF